MNRSTFLFSLGLLLLGLINCSRYQLPTAASTQHYLLESATDSLQQTPTSERIAILLEPYKTELDGRMNEVIGQAARAMPKRTPESTLGNWICDALQTRAQQISKQPVSASIQNYGGIRIPELPAGPITIGKIYELMPFDNTLVIVEMPGVITQQLFDQLAADRGWPVSEEVHFTIQDGRAQGLQIKKVAIDPQATYYIAMPDYIANGGGDCAFLRELPRQETGLLIRDILIQKVHATTADNSPVESFLSGRVLTGN